MLTNYVLTSTKYNICYNIYYNNTIFPEISVTQDSFFYCLTTT